MSGPSSEGDASTLGNKLKGMNLAERPRIAKKSTSVESSKYGSMTKRQAALASKDKSKQDLAKMLNAEDSPDEEAAIARDRRRVKKLMVKRFPGAAYDSAGVHVSGADPCDCLQDDCPGCHFRCPTCLSLKCGIECRVNRKYVYEQVEYHGYEFSITNPLLK